MREQPMRTARRQGLNALIVGLVMWNCIPYSVTVRPPLSGTIVDSHTGHPIAGARVEAKTGHPFDNKIASSQSDAPAEATTDVSGNWTLPAQTERRAIFLCGIADYAPKATSYTVSADGYRTASFEPWRDGGYPGMNDIDLSPPPKTIALEPAH